jgi:putative ABC transport system permease protein
MNTVFLALRNILRNKRRTAITFLAIISGLIGIIVFGGYVENTYMGLREQMINTQLGHIQLFKKGYTEKGVTDPAKYLIEDPDSVQKAITAFPYVKYMRMVSDRLTFSGLVSTGEQTLSFKGVGVDPAKEQEMSYFESITDGMQISPEVVEEGEDVGVVGTGLMKALGAEVGDYVTILTNTVDGVINAADFKVVGVAQTGTKEYDAVFIKFPIKFARKLLNTDSAEKIVVLLDKTEDVPTVATLLNDLIEEQGLDIEIIRWDELAEFYHKVVNIYDGIFDVITVIIGIIVFFSIANTMSMTVFERVKEIGTLRAIGTTRWGITKLFLVEGFLVGILGSALGIIAGIVTALAINFTGGIEMAPPPGMTVGIIAEIQIVPEVILYALFLTILVAVFSSVYPAIKASRLKIVDALQYT